MHSGEAEILKRTTTALLVQVALLATLLTVSHPVRAQSESGTPTADAAQAIVLNKSIRLNTTDVSVRISPIKFHVGPVEHDAWLYKTTGMSSLKQPELLVIVLKKKFEGDDAFPPGPVQLLSALAKAPKPECWNQLDTVKFNPFPGAEFAAMMFVPFDGLNGVSNVARGSLACVAITQEELEVSKNAGSTRVKAALALQSHYYPCPVWCDRERKSVFVASHLEQMKKDPLLGKLPHFGSFSSVVSADDVFSWKIGQAEGKLIGQSLAQYKGQLRVALTFDPRATAFPVWAEPGQPMHAVGTNGAPLTRLSGSFLVVGPAVNDDEVRQISDGFALLLSNSSMDKLVSALSTGKSLTLPLAGSKRFVISWDLAYDPETSLEVPVFNGDAPVKLKVIPRTTPNQVALQYIAPISSTEEMKKAITKEALDAYAHQLADAAIKELRAMKTKRRVEFTFMCNAVPGQKLEVFTLVGPTRDSEASGGWVKKLVPILGAIKPPSPSFARTS